MNKNIIDQKLTIVWDHWSTGEHPASAGMPASRNAAWHTLAHPCASIQWLDKKRLCRTKYALKGEQKKGRAKSGGMWSEAKRGFAIINYEL